MYSVFIDHFTYILFFSFTKQILKNFGNFQVRQKTFNLLNLLDKSRILLPVDSLAKGLLFYVIFFYVGSVNSDKLHVSSVNSDKRLVNYKYFLMWTNDWNNFHMSFNVSKWLKQLCHEF